MLGVIQGKVHGCLTILVLFVFFFGFAFFSLVEANPRAYRVEEWAVIVGVSDYEYLTNLMFCDDDAIGLYNQMASTWGASHVKLLTDAYANKTNIEGAIKSWLAPVEDANDMVLFFFSGHGTWGPDVYPNDEADGRDEYICPHDSLPTSYDNDIRDDELAEWLNVLDSGRIVVILDTCYSGGFINKTAKTEVDQPLGGLNDGFVKDLSKNGHVILTASAENEKSLESSELEHGVFSYYIIEALNKLELVDANANHEISAEEIFYYAEPRTVDFTKDKQHPQLYDGYAEELTLITTATITFDTSPRVASLTVDGTTYSISHLSMSFTWATNTIHEFNVSSVVSEIREDVSVESNHPYTNNYNNTWTLTRPNATRIRVHFTYIHTEKNYDYVYILDDAGKVYGNYTGDFEDVWSVWVPENTINVRLTSDYLITDDGFVIDKLEWTSQQIRHMFISWNDGNASTSRTLTVSETETYTAIYKTQHYLIVNSPHGTSSGEGWYDNCTTTYATLDTGIIDHLNGTRRVFTHWSGDASGINYMASDPIHMNGPKTATANWKTQYPLVVRTDPTGLSPQPTREPAGEAGLEGWWYDDSISVQLTAQPVTGYVFLNWDVDAIPVSGNPIIVHMDGPCEVTAHYIADATGPAIGDPSLEPNSPDPYEKVKVSVNVTDDPGGVREVILSHSTDGGAAWTDVPMNKTIGDTYIGEILGLPAGTNVQYKITAYDNADNEAVEPKDGEYYVYHVVPEFPSGTAILATLCIVSVVLMFFKRREKNRPKTHSW